MPTATASFALRLLERLGSRQVVLSPASVQSALTALRPGVSGAARAALDEVPAPEPREIADPGVVLALAQAVWVDDDHELLADLGIDAFTIDFADPGAADRVNAWAAERTRGMVPHVIDAFEEDEVLALTDAATSTGPGRAVRSRLHRAAPVHPAGRRPRSTSPTMHADGSFEYFEDDDPAGACGCRTATAASCASSP